MKLNFDAELRGHDGTVFPVYCEVQPPHVGGQRSQVYLAIPAQHIAKETPKNPCSVTGKIGSLAIAMQGVHWRRFPISSTGVLGLEAIELLHIEKLTIQRPSMNDRREIRFHLGPISYLRSESSFVHFGDLAQSEELFELNLPELGTTSFVAEWVTTYHRDLEIPGATVTAGFSAVAGIHSDGPIDIDRMVAKFKSSLEVLSVLFRQAVTLHGWTYTDSDMVSTWIAPLEPNVTPSARDARGDFVAKPQEFVECATRLVHAYEKADKNTRSLVRHLLVATNPHNDSRTADRFLFMFSALERVIDAAWKTDQTPQSPSIATNLLIENLERLQKTVATKGGEYAIEVSDRLRGLIRIVNNPSIRDKIKAFLHVYPAMTNYGADLWPILGAGKNHGLRELRHSLAHGSSSFVSVNVVSVAEWHLAIYLERLIFLLLMLPLPEGIFPGSFLLRIGGKGWYEREWWVPLQSKPGQPI